MAVVQAELDTLNAAALAYFDALRTVVDGMAADEELVYTPIKETVITAEAVGTAAGDGETKGDFALDWPVDKAADVTSILVGTAAHAVIEGTAAFTSGDEVRVFSGRDAADSGQLQFDSAKTGAITATYAAAKVETAHEERRHVREDETGATTGKGFATAPGNNIKSRDNFKAVVSPGIWSSSDAV